MTWKICIPVIGALDVVIDMVVVEVRIVLDGGWSQTLQLFLQLKSI